MLHSLMEREGITTQAELARGAGVPHVTIGHVANLRVGAFNADGTPSKVTQALCAFFGCLPEDIYPPEVLHVGIPNNVVERVVSSEEVAKHISQKELDPALQIERKIDPRFLLEQMERLTNRERRVLTWRFFEGKTLQAIGDELDLSSERVRSIEVRALRKMRKVLKFDPGDQKHDSSAAGLNSRYADASKSWILGGHR